MWISGLINPAGTPARLLAAAASGRVTVVVSEHLLAELAEVLARPKFRRWISVDDAMAFLDALRLSADLYSDPADVPHLTRDVDDDYLPALADAAGATLVSGDNDLLDAGLAPTVLTARQILDRLDRR